jgi:hypothetical protein
MVKQLILTSKSKSIILQLMATEQPTFPDLPPAANMTTQELVNLAISKSAESIALLKAAAQKERESYVKRALEIGANPETIASYTDTELFQHSLKSSLYEMSAHLMNQATLKAMGQTHRRGRERGRTRFLE